MSTSQLDKKLAQFLAGNDLGYSRDEIKTWFAPRDGATHGDLSKAPTLVGEARVRPFLARMEQAAYDLLFNKEVWHDPSRLRRNVLMHPVATTDSAAHGIRTTQGRSASFRVQLLDRFAAYPLDLKAILRPLPDGWWAREGGGD